MKTLLIALLGLILSCHFAQADSVTLIFDAGGDTFVQTGDEQDNPDDTIYKCVGPMQPVYNPDGKGKTLALWRSILMTK